RLWGGGRNHGGEYVATEKRNLRTAPASTGERKPRPRIDEPVPQEPARQLRRLDVSRELLGRANQGPAPLLPTAERARSDDRLGHVPGRVCRAWNTLLLVRPADGIRRLQPGLLPGREV